MIRRWCYFFSAFIWIFSFCFVLSAEGAEDALPSEVDHEYEKGMDQFDFRGIQDYLDRQIGGSGGGLSFEGLMKSLLKGDIRQAAAFVTEGARDALGREVSHSAGLMGQILVLGVLGAVLSNFSGVFAGNQVSETGFFVTYLLVFTFLAASFQESLSVAFRTVEQLMEFMKILAPSYFLAVSMSGAMVSSIVWCQLVLLMVSLVDALYLNVLLPLVRIYVLLVLTGHIIKEEMFSKWTEMLKTIISWGMKTLIGVVVGIQAVQGMILPYVDSMKHVGLRKLVEVVPVVGQGMSSVSQMIFGAGVLIKNTMGAASVVILFIIVSVPVVKLAVLMVLYQFLAAALQPVSDKRLVSCIGSIADGHKLLLQIVLAASLLFMIAIALVCMTTNTAYLA